MEVISDNMSIETHVHSIKPEIADVAEPAPEGSPPESSAPSALAGVIQPDTIISGEQPAPIQAPPADTY